LPTSVESRALPVRQVLGVASRTGCPGAVYVALGLPQDCGILFLGVETLRFIVVPLVVLALSLPVQAFDPLLFVAHSLHETNHRQTYHFAERSVWWPGGPAHFVQVDPHEDYIRDYHMFWHAALDVMPLFLGETVSRLVQVGFSVAKSLIVAHNNRYEANKYWLVYYTAHF